MKPPTELELAHLAGLYDPLKAHEYYLRTRKLKGRDKGSGDSPNSEQMSGFAKANANRHANAKPKQRAELQARIQSLTKKLGLLEAKIREMEHKAASEDRKGKAKKERAAKEKDKPKTAAEKAKAARENEKYRDKHKQELKSKAKKADSTSGGGKKGSGKGGKATVSDLKVLAKKVKGQIAVAKQKLAAL